MLNMIGKRASAAAGVTFLDVTTMLQSRTDGHMPHDCGHWCLPGPYDVTTQLLFNAATGNLAVPLGIHLARKANRPRAGLLHTGSSLGRGRLARIAQKSKRDAAHTA